MLKNTRKGYGWVSIILHWLMAMIIMAMFALGLYMVDLDYYDRWYHQAPHIHESVGVLLFFMLLMRWFWRLSNPQPALTGKTWEQWLALATHRSHYVLMFGVMLTGYLIPTANGVGIEVFDWFTLPALINTRADTADLIGNLHWLSAWGLLLLAGLHSVAALKHHFINHDPTLRRMWRSMT